MKRSDFSVAALVLLSLTAACTMVGRSADNNAPAANAPSTDQPAARDAKAQAPAEAPRLGSIFRGSIGDAKIELDIKREGSTLTGTYYYLKSGSSNRLNLKGKIDADGSFTMQETDAAGKQTGEFKGKWKEESFEAGASLEGEWLKPGQKSEGLGFYAWQQMIDFSSVQIATRETKESIKPKRAELTAEYPELSGSPNADAFNQLAKSKVMRSLAAFRKDVASTDAEDVKRMAEMQMNNYIEVTYAVEYADDDLVSLSFNEDTFMGGAHPNHNTFTLTYDLKAGREVKLADLFKPGSKYLQAIAAYCVKDLKARKDPETGENLGLLTDDIFTDGAKPTADNYANWNITRKGLLITFPPYQVAAYAYGPQSVIVPVSALKDIAILDGPLAKAKG